MTVVKSGLKCDVCGSYIFPWDEFQDFTIVGIEGKLQCHEPKCRESVQRACETKDYRELPEGPLRNAFEKQEKESTGEQV